MNTNNNPQQEHQSLNFSDLELMLNILAAVSQRGAIKPDEMAVVGALYNKLNTWVQAHKQELENQENKTETSETEDE